MKKGIKINNLLSGTFGTVRIIDDFLPSPEEIVLKEHKVKVTMALTKRTVDFFKQQAKSQRSQYQKLIRRLLDEYARKHEEK